MGVKEECHMKERGESVFRGWFGMSRANLAAKLGSLANDLEALDSFDDVGAAAVVIDSWALPRRVVPCLIVWARGSILNTGAIALLANYEA